MDEKEEEMSDWTIESFGEAVIGLLPGGFFKHGAGYEDAHLVIRELINANNSQLLELCKKQQPENWFLEMCNE